MVAAVTVCARVALVAVATVLRADQTAYSRDFPAAAPALAAAPPPPVEHTMPDTILPNHGLLIPHECPNHTPV